MRSRLGHANLPAFVIEFADAARLVREPRRELCNKLVVVPPHAHLQTLPPTHGALTRADQLAKAAMRSASLQQCTQAPQLPRAENSMKHMTTSTISSVDDVWAFQCVNLPQEVHE